MANVMYCLNGHFVVVVNPVLRARNMGQLHALLAQGESEGPKRLPAFCATCGASNISACQHCQIPIEVDYPGGTPGYCCGCGKPFPWTETALSAAKEYTDELDQLSPEEKTALKGTFDYLTSDTAKTPLAANRFKKIMSKIGPVAEGVFKKVLETVVTEAAKKGMGL
jgi:hypothetical protein